MSCLPVCVLDGKREIELTVFDRIHKSRISVYPYLDLD
jgi:hypothetical protein